MNQPPVVPFEFPEVRVVEASAGSGKTYALARRYIQLLLLTASRTAFPMRHILAITFTNKASFEMKARILEFLKKIALKEFNDREKEHILAPLGLDAESASPLAFKLMEDLMRNYNFFQVQTIDSFINALLSGCAFKIDLSANFRIKTNVREYIEEAMERLLDEAQEDKDLRKIFETFLHQYLFLENRTGWFPKKDLLKLMASLKEQHNTYALDFLRTDLSSDDLFLRKKKILKLMDGLKDALPENTHATFRKSLLGFLIKYPESFDLDEVSDYFLREEFPATKGGAVPKEVAKLWDQIRKELRVLSEEEASSVFNPYIDVFNRFDLALSELARKDDVLFLGELNKKARALFDEGALTVEELYYRMATRFHHYLIDEFQDTSLLQWKNLGLMIEEALSTGGSLFYVGDKKQAIYGFRGGEVGLFDEIRRTFNVPVRQETLSQNFRSLRTIVEFNNAIFAEDNLRVFLKNLAQHDSYKDLDVFTEADFQVIRQVFGQSHQVPRADGDGGYVSLRLVDFDKKEHRDEAIRMELLGLLADLKNRFALSDIAILTRNNSEVEDITNWLLNAGISVESERTSNCLENPLIGEFVHLLRFLNSPIDDFHFAHFIMGDVFAKLTATDPQVYHDFLFEARKDKIKREAYLYRLFRERFPELWEKYFEDFFKNVGLYPLYELVVSLYQRLDILKNFPDHQGFWMHLLELIKKREEENTDLTSFLEYLDDPQPEDLFVQVREHNAVRVTTIHKSKGLEFPVVVIPYLGMEPQLGIGGHDGQQSYILDFEGEGVRLLRLKDKYNRFSPQLAAHHSFHLKKAFVNELNQVYVALTRPVCELHGFIPSKVASSFNFVRYLIPEGSLCQGSPVTSFKPKKIFPSRLTLPSSTYREWFELVKEEFLDFGIPYSYREAKKGELLHFYLSFIGDLNERPLAEIFKEARPKAACQFKNLEDAAEVEKMVEKLCGRKELKPFFELKGAQVFNEREFIDTWGQTKRIDRLIVFPNEVWVVDYKMRDDELKRADYEEQVKTYMKLMKSLYPKHAVKGFLIYVQENLVVDVG